MYTFIRWFLQWFLRIYHRVDVVGQENVPTSAPLIVVGNHVSYLDSIYLGAIFPRRIHFMAKSELFQHSVLGFFLRKTGSFPVEREKADLSAIRTSLAYLQQNRVVGLFPEGAIQQEGTSVIQEIKQGAAFLALKGQAAVVPVYIAGTREALPLGKWWIKPAKIKITIGPILYSSHEGTAKERQVLLSEQIISSLSRMAQQSESEEKSSVDI